jgi:acid phosphatase
MSGRNIFPGNCGLGALTTKGFQQQLLNGKLLRTAYIDQNSLLSPQLNLAELWVRSDNMPRTIQSAQGLLLGLYPPSTDLQAAQILDIYTQDLELDDIMSNYNLCPRYAEVQAESQKTPAYLQHFQNITLPLFKELQNLVHQPVNNIGEMFDCMTTHVCHDVALPSGIDNLLYQRVVAEVNYEYNNSVSYPNASYNSQLGIGFLIRDFFLASQGQVNGSTTAKLMLWSAHDVTLFSLLVAFGVWDGRWPAYASMLVFEFYEQSDSSTVVRANYNGKTLVIPGCGNELCSWDNFQKIVASLIPRDPADCDQTSIFKIRPLTLVLDYDRLG